MARTLGLDASDLALASGETSPDKVLLLPLSAEEAERRWTAYLAMTS